MSDTTADTRLLTIVLAIIGALVVFPVLFMGFGMMGTGSMMGGMWGHETWGSGTASGWMLLVSVLIRGLFLAAVLGTGYLVYRSITKHDRNSDRALEELRLAYARGELSDEEYETRRERLERDA
jgi:putative membrane protein